MAGPEKLFRCNECGELAVSSRYQACVQCTLQKSQSSEWAGFVYFVLVLSGDPIVKIGVAEDQPVTKRIEQLQIGCPYKLQLIGVLRPKGKTARDLEAEIHKDLEQDRVRGEWFGITERMDKWFQQMAEHPAKLFDWGG